MSHVDLNWRMSHAVSPDVMPSAAATILSGKAMVNYTVRPIDCLCSQICEQRQSMGHTNIGSCVSKHMNLSLFVAQHGIDVVLWLMLL